MNKIFGEFKFFRSQPKNIRTLLATNMLYAIILPVVEIFVGAYIMRNTGKPSTVAAYQLSMYVGIVITSLLNGLLLKYFKSSRLYAFGILVSALVLIGTMFMNNPDIILLCVSGCVLGASTGFFWTNRYLLTLIATDDDNRNYFFGLESFFFTFWNILVPLAVGAFLGSIKGVQLFDTVFDVNNGYQIITCITLIIAACACLVLSRGKFENPAQKDFFFIKFHSLWNKMLALAGLKGMVQGFLVTAPAILVMLLVGEEGSLGLIQGIAGGVTAIIVYVLGRVAKPKHRMLIFGIGLFIFFAGTIFNGIMFSALGVILFMLCKVFFQPIHDLAYYPVMMRTIDIVSKIENRNKYTYIMSHEIGLFLGRFAGMALFIILATFISEEFALKYALIIVAAIQLLSLPLARHIVKKSSMLVVVFAAIFAAGCKTEKPVEQVAIARVEMMPNLPQPYKIIDYKKKAIDFDALAFNFDSTTKAGVLIWLDSAKRNVPQVTFGLYTALRDVRQGAKNNNGEFHESINSLAAILGAGLMGIDKTNQNGFNYVKMTQNYFNTDNGWNIMMNNTCPEVAMQGGGYGRDWWYDVLPNVLYYAVCDIFPNVENADNIQRTIAEQFYKADSVLDGNYDYSYFDYAAMQGKRNQIPFQQDAAGGHGYVLLAAYQKFGDPRYLQGAKSAIAALDNQKESRFYEILLPMGCYAAARLNAEHNTNYDLAKMLDWVFEGCKNPEARYQWGVIVGKWGDYDVSGLQGSIGGYAFFMNSMKMAIPLVPMVKYAPQYARAIGKWMLNNVNAARLFYPDEIDGKHQFLAAEKDYTNGIIAYEGLSYSDIYNTPALKDVHPVALGDGPNWNKNNPKESMFSLYSTSPVGILGAMIDTTEVQGILRINCNTTDFYAEYKERTYLYYNPHQEEKTITYQTGQINRKVNLYDVVSGKYLAKDVSEKCEIVLPADNAVLIIEK